MSERVRFVAEIEARLDALEARLREIQELFDVMTTLAMANRAPRKPE